MSLSAKARARLGLALTSKFVADEVATAINASTTGSLTGSAPAASTPAVITYTASADTYAAIGTLTIANGGTPTALELLHYIKELQRQITALQTKLTARGVTL